MQSLQRLQFKEFVRPDATAPLSFLKTAASLKELALRAGPREVAGALSGVPRPCDGQRGRLAQLRSVGTLVLRGDDAAHINRLAVCREPHGGLVFVDWLVLSSLRTYWLLTAVSHSR